MSIQEGEYNCSGRVTLTIYFDDIRTPIIEGPNGFEKSNDAAKLIVKYIFKNTLSSFSSTEISLSNIKIQLEEKYS